MERIRKLSPPALAAVAGCWLACAGPSAESPGVSRDPAAEELPAAEWVHRGATWSWGHPVSGDFRWPGPGELRAAWLPSAEARREERAQTDASATVERVVFETGAEVVRAGHLVAPRRQSSRGSRAGHPRLVVWIVADTLRADVAEQELGLRARFDERLRFTAAYAPATWTLPSMASMFTGMPPASLRGPAGDLIVLPTVLPTVAERAREQGFVTVAVVANPTVNHDNGFSRGFDRFTVPSYADGWKLPDASWVEGHALRELETFAGDDVFLLLHFMDPHDPYRDHDSGERFVPPPSGPQAEALRDEEVAAMFRAYRSEARHLDEVLERLWARIEEQRPVDLLVFTADHGEEFLDHGGTRHGPTVLPEVSRVPLWVGGERAGALARRLERAGLGADAPTSLQQVGTLLLDTERWLPGGRATVESAVHGPPRFAWVDESGHWSLVSRWWTERAPVDGIEAWLRTQPDLFIDPVERPPDRVGEPRWSREPQAPPGTWSRVPDATWVDLVAQLSGLAPGRWVFWRRPEWTSLADASIERAALDASAWALGPCAAMTEPVMGEGPCLAYLGPTAEAPFGHAPAQRRWVLDQRPGRLPPEGAVSWVEAPRDTEVPEDVSRTMERLRALGYIQ